jgi:hypothetical protein
MKHATVEDELRQMAHDLYARARSSIDPSTQRMLMRLADNILRQADEIRRGRTVIQAERPMSTLGVSQVALWRIFVLVQIIKVTGNYRDSKDVLFRR